MDSCKDVVIVDVQLVASFLVCSSFGHNRRNVRVSERNGTAKSVRLFRVESLCSDIINHFLFQVKNTVKSLEYTEPSVLIIKKSPYSICMNFDFPVDKYM